MNQVTLWLWWWPTANCTWWQRARETLSLIKTTCIGTKPLRGLACADINYISEAEACHRTDKLKICRRVSQDRQSKIHGPGTRPTTCQMGVTRPTTQNAQHRHKTDNLSDGCHKPDNPGCTVPAQDRQPVGRVSQDRQLKTCTGIRSTLVRWVSQDRQLVRRAS